MKLTSFVQFVQLILQSNEIYLIENLIFFNAKRKRLKKATWKIRIKWRDFYFVSLTRFDLLLHSIFLFGSLTSLQEKWMPDRSHSRPFSKNSIKRLFPKVSLKKNSIESQRIKNTLSALYCPSSNGQIKIRIFERSKVKKIKRYSVEFEFHFTDFHLTLCKTITKIH